MPTSRSIAGKATLKHEAGDTLRRTIRITTTADEAPVNLTGATKEVIVSRERDGEALHTLTVGEGLIDSNPSDGEIKIEWETAGLLERRTTYWYKYRVTFPSGTIKTYIEAKIRTL